MGQKFCKWARPPRDNITDIEVVNGALELLTPYGDAGANERCESCNKGGDLLACSFCNVVYHNTPACLGSNVLCEAAIANEDYEWACPKCFKIAVRELIKPKRKPPPPRKRSKRS